MQELQTAQALIKHYQTESQQNFGIGIFILNVLWWKYNYLPIHKYPAYNTFRQFIIKNRDTLEKTDFRELLKNPESFTQVITTMCCLFAEKYLTKEALEPHEVYRKQNIGNIELVRDICYKKLATDEGEERYHTIGSSNALFFDTELELGNIHVRRIAQLEQRTVPYRPDPKFPNWPINKINDLNIYASKGPESPQNSMGFFIEIFNKSVDKIGYNITTIVAIGEEEKDFFCYFQAYR